MLPLTYILPEPKKNKVQKNVENESIKRLFSTFLYDIMELLYDFDLKLRDKLLFILGFMIINDKEFHCILIDLIIMSLCIS